MRSWIELSRNQTMGTSLPEKPLSCDLACSVQTVRRLFNPLDAAGRREVHMIFPDSVRHAAAG